MRRVLAIVAALAAIFFTFSSVRVLIVPGLLRHLRAGGGGAYLGTAVFPLLAIGFAWATVRLSGPSSSVRQPAA